MPDQADPQQVRNYGRVMVALSPVFLGFSTGSLVSISVFLKPLTAEFGWLRGETTFAYLAGALTAGSCGILMGYLADRYDTRRIVMAGTVVLGLGYLSMARISSLWQFYLVAIIIAGLGSATYLAPLMSNIGGWFTRNRGLAMGIATAGQSLGQGGVPYFASFMIVAFGWRAAYNWLGLFALVVLLPLALLIRNPPGARGSGAKGATATTVAGGQFPVSPARSISLLGFAAIFCCITMSTAIVHVVALASDRGLAPESAARVLLLLMVSGFFGRLFFGRLSDRIGGLPAYLTASLWQTSLVFWFTMLDSPHAFYLLAVLFGFGYSGVMTCVIVCAQEYVPSSHSGVAIGVVIMFAWMGMGIGGYQAGYFFDITGNYTQSFANAVIAGLFNAAIVSGLLLYHGRKRAGLIA